MAWACNIKTVVYYSTSIVTYKIKHLKYLNVHLFVIENLLLFMRMAFSFYASFEQD